MYTITNKADLKSKYSILKKIEAMNEDSLKEIINEIKQSIRKYTNAPINENRIIKDYGIDGIILLSPLPAHISSYDEAEEYFEDKLYIHATPSAYDCTGQAFTSWYKLFNRNNRWYTYHRIAYDV